MVAEYYKIPDDIAGATLMAAGASSPELFSSITALFITHSSLGLGTIVGSEIFNQLWVPFATLLLFQCLTRFLSLLLHKPHRIICAGAIFAGPSTGLVLDPVVVSREVFFYFLSIVLLYAALQDTRPDPDDPSGEDHIYIQFGEALYVFSGYVVYVVVCSNMDAILRLWKGKKQRRDHESQAFNEEYPPIDYGLRKHTSSSRVSMAFVDQRIPFLREKALMKHEPSGNFQQKEYYRTKSISENSIEQARSMGRFSDGNSLRKFLFVVNTDKPSQDRSLYTMELNSVRVYSCRANEDVSRVLVLSIPIGHQ